jgi:plastocyanin
MHRRRLLAVAGTGLATALAGCGGGSTDGTGGTDSPTETAAPTDTESPAPTDTQAPPETPTPTDTETTTPPFETPGGTATATETAADDVAQTVAVGPGTFSFDPGGFEVAVGETVRWVWESSNHNVVADATPAGSTWTGTEGGASRTFDSGYTYEYTFETPGEYDYYCSVHRANGMTGSFTVVEG